MEHSFRENSFERSLFLDQFLKKCSFKRYKLTQNKSVLDSIYSELPKASAADLITSDPSVNVYRKYSRTSNLHSLFWFCLLSHYLTLCLVHLVQTRPEQKMRHVIQVLVQSSGPHNKRQNEGSISQRSFALSFPYRYSLLLTLLSADSLSFFSFLLNSSSSFPPIQLIPFLITLISSFSPPFLFFFSYSSLFSSSYLRQPFSLSSSFLPFLRVFLLFIPLPVPFH